MKSSTVRTQRDSTGILPVMTGSICPVKNLVTEVLSLSKIYTDGGQVHLDAHTHHTTTTSAPGDKLIVSASELHRNAFVPRGTGGGIIPSIDGITPSFAALLFPVIIYGSFPVTNKCPVPLGWWPLSRKLHAFVARTQSQPKGNGPEIYPSDDGKTPSFQTSCYFYQLR